MLEGEPLQIIILQAHAIDTKEDEAFVDPIDIYVDELYLSDGTTSISLSELNEAEIVKTEVYNVNGILVGTWGAEENVIPVNYGKGVYIVRQADSTGKVAVRKMINE